MKHLSVRFPWGLSLCLALAAAGWAQAPKQTLKPADYGLWEMLFAPNLSNDGHWFTYTLARADGERRMVLRNVDTPQEGVVPNGAQPQFSDDSKWACYLIGPSTKEAEAAREKKQPFEPRLVLKNLATGEDRIFDGVQHGEFLKTSKFLLISDLKPQPAQEGGADLIVVNLETGAQTVFGNVVSADPNEDGTLVALTVDSGGKYEGIQLLDPATSSLKTIYWGKDEAGGLVWAEKSDTFTYFLGKPDEKKEGPWNTVALVSDVRKSTPTITTIDPAKIEAFPKDYRIAEYAGIDISEDGSAVLFGICKWLDKKKPSTVKPEDKPDVDVWNSKDVVVQPEQQREGPREKMRTTACLWRAGKFLKIGDEKLKDPMVAKGMRYAVVPDGTPYETPVKVGGLEFSDWYVIDLTDGKRTKVLTKTQWQPQVSAEGNYLAYWKDRNWWVYDIAKGTHTNLTGKLKVSFESEDYDGPQKEKPSQSQPVWLADDKGLILNDRYDCWCFDPATGRGTKWTNGRPDKISYRPTDVYPDRKPIGLDKPIYFAAFNNWTKATGVAMRAVDGTFKVLTMDDALISLIGKAKNADRMLFQMQTFEKSPNLFVTNAVFTEAKPLTKTNPQQANYLWGKAELVHYKSTWGKELAGILIYPADYKAGSSYPMVTYIYERMSDGLHQYRPPQDRDSYNAQILSQNGYFVFLPDITYRINEPGVSAVQCLEPAVAAVVAKHVGVDPQRVGLMGHSWGAYQTAFTMTVSKAFAAGVAGAPLTELMSMYNSFYWNSGQTNQVIFESSQGRFAGPWWENMKAYMDNSPVFQAAKLTKPIMIECGDHDGAVDWTQGQYLYNTLRRMGKSIIMLVYPGENHGLAKKGNQLDYAHRLRHFFDVYLKGAKPEPWITEGVPFSKKDAG